MAGQPRKRIREIDTLIAAQVQLNNRLFELCPEKYRLQHSEGSLPPGGIGAAWIDAVASAADSWRGLSQLREKVAEQVRSAAEAAESRKSVFSSD